MDYDRNKFLDDVFEDLIGLRGDVEEMLDVAIENEIGAHVTALRRLVHRYRRDLVAMAEEYRRSGQPVSSRWKS